MNPNERVSCPFDPVHVVERRRFQAHLIKCKRNLKSNHDYVQCQFWHLHYVRESELADHHATCEHRLQKESNKKTWDAEATKFFQPKLLVDEHVKQPMELESWDDIVPAPAFQPDKLIAKSIHMTVPQGLTKSKRKEFKERERLRLRELEEEKQGAAGGNKDLRNSDNVPQPPRKPAENPLKRLGRLAAKFPTQQELEESERSSRATFSSALSHQSRSDSGSIIIGGRGRGLLGGWNHITEPDRAYRFKADEFPTLGK